MATDPDYDRKKMDKPTRLFQADGFEVDWQKGHIDVPDGGADIPQELIIALDDKGWAEYRVGGPILTGFARDLGLALLREFDPAALAPLPISGEVTEEALEEEIDNMGERPTQSHARLIIAQVLDFAAGDPYVEGRLITRLQKKLGTTGAQIKKEVEFVTSERDALAPQDLKNGERREVPEYDEDDRPTMSIGRADEVFHPDDDDDRR